MFSEITLKISQVCLIYKSAILFFFQHLVTIFSVFSSSRFSFDIAVHVHVCVTQHLTLGKRVLNVQ